MIRALFALLCLCVNYFTFQRVAGEKKAPAPGLSNQPAS